MLSTCSSVAQSVFFFNFAPGYLKTTAGERTWSVCSSHLSDMGGPFRVAVVHVVTGEAEHLATAPVTADGRRRAATQVTVHPLLGIPIAWGSSRGHRSHVHPLLVIPIAWGSMKGHRSQVHPLLAIATAWGPSRGHRSHVHPLLVIPIAWGPMKGHRSQVHPLLAIATVWGSMKGHRSQVHPLLAIATVWGSMKGHRSRSQCTRSLPSPPPGGQLAVTGHSVPTNVNFFLSGFTARVVLDSDFQGDSTLTHLTIQVTQL